MSESDWGMRRVKRVPLPGWDSTVTDASGNRVDMSGTRDEDQLDAEPDAAEADATETESAETEAAGTGGDEEPTP
mgnify:CR=1 FL=1